MWLLWYFPWQVCSRVFEKENLENCGHEGYCWSHWGARGLLEEDTEWDGTWGLNLEPHASPHGWVLEAPAGAGVEMRKEQKENASWTPGRSSVPRRVWFTQSPAASRSSTWRPGKHPFGCDNPAAISHGVSTVPSGHGDRSQVPETERWVSSKEELKGSM